MYRPPRPAAVAPSRRQRGCGGAEALGHRDRGALRRGRARARPGVGDGRHRGGAAGGGAWRARGGGGDPPHLQRSVARSAAARAGDSTCLALSRELREMRARVADRQRYELSGRAYVLAGLSSHAQQRAMSRQMASGGGGAETLGGGWTAEERSVALATAGATTSYMMPAMLDMLNRSRRSRELRLPPWSVLVQSHRGSRAFASTRPGARTPRRRRKEQGKKTKDPMWTLFEYGESRFEESLGLSHHLESFLFIRAPLKL
ncbi:uncharacterized protein C2845_PM18G02530 [Panicum miliaceum]|uniref:VWA-Hint protein Vwaint domain-containing protein n=1 Tax=Panicum miliaceum TaxID=4540 RepID=A0A3L6PFW2_PANMI|nr:uncharacterized protein C2845_PM18G02530 [Panicum miliaceum]